jgi:hypothetical protein
MPPSSLSSSPSSSLVAGRPTPKLERVTILSAEPSFPVGIEAQYNPSQIQLDESASWTPDASRKDGVPQLEFTGNAARTLSVELFFDGLERRLDVKKAFVDPLGQLIRVMDPDGDEEHKRPPLVALAWSSGLPAFRGVIVSLSTKLTMFLADGTPVRATCSIKIMEATREALDRRAANRVAAPRR